MAMKNFWDPEKPSGFTEVTQKRRYLSLHIYVVQDKAGSE